MTPKFNIAIVLILAALAGACTPVTANRGNIVDPDKLAEIKTGQSNREQVANALGSPTHVATFDENVWYYYGRRTEQESFLDPEAIDRKVVRIAFDDNGIVQSIDDKSGEKPDDVGMVERITPTYGRSNTLIQDLFGGIGRPGLPVGKKGRVTGDMDR